MKYRKLDGDGDYTLGTGQDFYDNSPAAVAQAVRTRLRLFSGEWFLDPQNGTPWDSDVLGKNTQGAYDAVIKTRVLQTQGVTEILEYDSSLDRDTRALIVSVTIATQYGDATLRESITAS